MSRLQCIEFSVSCTDAHSGIGLYTVAHVCGISDPEWSAHFCGIFGPERSARVCGIFGPKWAALNCGISSPSWAALNCGFVKSDPYGLALNWSLYKFCPRWLALDWSSVKFDPYGLALNWSLNTQTLALHSGVLNSTSADFNYFIHKSALHRRGLLCGLLCGVAGLNINLTAAKCTDRMVLQRTLHGLAGILNSGPLALESIAYHSSFNTSTFSSCTVEAIPVRDRGESHGHLFIQCLVLVVVMTSLSTAGFPILLRITTRKDEPGPPVALDSDDTIRLGGGVRKVIQGRILAPYLVNSNNLSSWEGERVQL
ncbi:hypothetical protein B0H11DRAFT_1926018 [Mycena galericulata]|nr:hypothetical protein B0H11DRAFT_1926018 [Mycena galericulata]